MEQEIGYAQIPKPTDNQPKATIKIYHPYNIKAHKILIRSIIITPTILVLWSIYALIDGHTDVINFSRFPLAIILSAFFYFINIIILRIKYKLRFCNRHNNHSFSHQLNNHDNNPYHPGTRAWYTYGEGSKH